MSTVINIPMGVSNDNPIVLPITATPGTYRAVLSVNGREYVYPATAGAVDVQMENAFQANRTHTLKMYDGSGDLVDDTIYNITVAPVTNTAANNIYTIEVETTDGMASYSNGLIRAASSVDVFFEGAYMHGTAVSGPDSDTVNFPYRVDSKQRMIIKITR